MQPKMLAYCLARCRDFGREPRPRNATQLLTTILDAVYIDMKGHKSIVSVKLKPAFQAVPELVAPLLRGRDSTPDPSISLGTR